MNLSEFLLRWNERPHLWAFIRPWIPARTAPYSWLRLVAFAALFAVLFAVVPFAIFSALGEFKMLSWVAGVPAEFGACVGLSLGLVSRVCWNQRVARLAAAPDSPEAMAPWPRLGFFRRFCFGFLYITLLGLITPLLLFYAIENTRGAWAWRKTQAELKAKGECYEMSCVVPPPAADAENFFGTPFWQQFIYRKEALPNGGMTNIWQNGPGFAFRTNFALPDDPKKPKSPDGKMDLAAWAAQFQFVTTNRPKGRPNPDHLTFPLPAAPGRPAADVLLALSKFDGTLAEFAGAASRPRNRQPIHYEENFSALLPGLAAVKSGARISHLRAIARLESGDAAGAAADVMLAYRLGESLNEEPLLISQLVRYAADGIAHHALWEGLVAHRWNEAQLTALQQRLGQLDYAPSFIRALEGERAFGNQFMEMLISSHNRTQLLDQIGGGGDSGANTEAFASGSLMPTGWMRRNQAGLLEGYQLILEQARMAMNPASRPKSPLGIGNENDPVHRFSLGAAIQPSPFNIMIRLLLPAIGKATDKTDRAQTIARMALIACALERHRLAHGTYPEALAELAPAYLAVVPTDWMNGQPFHYERTADGWFRLWSVGPDGKDDGGIYRDETKKKSERPALDWPWPLPAPAEERLF